VGDRVDAGSPLARIGIVGLGLVGGSIAWSLRTAWPSTVVVGVDRTDVVDEALRRGAIDAAAASVADLADADLVVLAAPLTGIISSLDEAARAGLRGVVTDVGSTKRLVLRAARDAGVATFVGGHPMAGAERAGFDYARAGLFDGRPWLVVPPAEAPAAAIARVEHFARALGATPRRMTADEHDRTMAFVSGLPQVVAVSLMRAVGAAAGEAGLAAAGPALVEMTRLAASPVHLWTEIAASNADLMAEALAALVRELGAARDGMAGGAWVEEAFPDARRWRARLDPLVR
jgi:prephenate dehydrogenase